MPALRFREPRLHDRWLLEPLLRASDVGLCEYSFANLLCWQPVYGTRWALWRDEWLVLEYRHGREPRRVCPVGRGDAAAAVEWCLQDLATSGGEARVDFVPEGLARELRERGFDVVEDRDNADYLYARERIATLSDRRLRCKRKHVRQFTEHGPSSLELLDAAVQGACRDFVLRHAVDGQGRPRADVGPFLRGLQHAQELGMTGFVLRSRGEVVAVALGSALNEDTFAMHFECVDRSVPGVYQAIHQRSAQALPSRFAWVDREQDLGDLGLRASKLSYHPERLVASFSVRAAPARHLGLAA
jgi:hypothetical protein